MSESVSEIVASKIWQNFRVIDCDTVLAEFAANEINEERVQLAIIKLSEGSLEKLREFIAVAKIDWRDVLAWAEYPEEFAAATWRMEPDTVKRLRERDRKQYQDWLGTED